MADITTQTEAGYAHASPRGILRAIGNAFIHLAETNSRVRRAEALHALSDADLAAKGLKREDISRHVFGDILYI